MGSLQQPCGSLYLFEGRKGNLVPVQERNKSGIVFAQCLSKSNIAESFLKENDETLPNEMDTSNEDQSTERK